MKALDFYKGTSKKPSDIDSFRLANAESKYSVYIKLKCL